MEFTQNTIRSLMPTFLVYEASLKQGGSISTAYATALPFQWLCATLNKLPLPVVHLRRNDCYLRGIKCIKYLHTSRSSSSRNAGLPRCP